MCINFPFVVRGREFESQYLTYVVSALLRVEMGHGRESQTRHFLQLATLEQLRPFAPIPFASISSTRTLLFPIFPVLHTVITTLLHAALVVPSKLQP